MYTTFKAPWSCHPLIPKEMKLSGVLGSAPSVVLSTTQSSAAIQRDKLRLRRSYIAVECYKSRTVNTPVGNLAYNGTGGKIISGRELLAKVNDTRNGRRERR